MLSLPVQMKCTILKSNYRNSNPQHDVLLHPSKSQVQRVSIMLLQRERHVKWLHSLGDSKLQLSYNGLNCMLLGTFQTVLN